MLMKFRKYSLALAESFDAWRVVPRMMLISYAILVMYLYLWFKSIPTFVQEKCDSAILKVLLETGISLEEARMTACTIVDVVGGPTAAQSAFVTTIIGLSSAIFALYTTTGRRWESGLPLDLNKRFSTIENKPAPTSNTGAGDGMSDEDSGPRL